MITFLGKDLSCSKILGSDFLIEHFVSQHSKGVLTNSEIIRASFSKELFCFCFSIMILLGSLAINGARLWREAGT